VDRAAEGGDLDEVARAWVRSAQVERALGAVVPPAAKEVAQAEEADTPAVRRTAAPPVA
jgi:hypothetical protein